MFANYFAQLKQPIALVLVLPGLLKHLSTETQQRILILLFRIGKESWPFDFCQLAMESFRRTNELMLVRLWSVF